MGRVRQSLDTIPRGPRGGDLDETVYRTRQTAGQKQRFGFRRSDGLLHACTHAHYTSAQVVNMLRHCGIAKLPQVMLMAMAMIEAG